MGTSTPTWSAHTLANTVRQKVFIKKTWYTPPMLKKFRHPKLVKQWRVVPRKLLAMWDKKIRQKIVILLISEIFWYQNISETHRGSPKKFFGSVGQKKSTENCDIPLLCWKFFDTQKWWNTEGFPHETFLHREKKNSTKSWYFYYPGSFWNQYICETHKGSPHDVFGNVRPKNFQQKIVIDPSYA